MNTTLRCALAGVACSLAVFASLAAAGPLNPPAGAVAPTAKPLAEVEPRTAINATNTPGDADSLFKITQPGSYYLTGNITGVVGKHGIEIAASGVTVDLSGFDLAGVPAMGAFDGVNASVGSLSNIVVLNGSVRNWGGDGVDLGGVLAVGGRIRGVTASGNGFSGIFVGPYTVISDCTATANAGSGFSTSTSCTLSECIAASNTIHGFALGNGCVAASCAAYDNDGNGFFTGAASTLTACSAYINAGNGIGVATGCTVSACASRNNTGNGIQCSSACLISSNTCAGNGSGAGNGAGILATGADNRIEGNNCTGADRGIDVNGVGNIIVRNTCSGNSTADWDIVANNYYGPIVDRSGAVTAGVTGSAAGSTLATTDANANFTY